MQNVIPRWRGFNLLEMFTKEHSGNFIEDDFRWISDFGFNFIRLPLSYLLWIKDNDVFNIDERVLEEIDRAIDLGRKYKMHVCLNFHRAPGYCVNKGHEEPFNLWRDEKALEAFCLHWEVFSKRYKGISSDQLSFNLVNEPPHPSEERKFARADYERVVRAATAAIRKTDPGRLIIIDGISYGNLPCPELADIKIAQSCRAYLPMEISHYKAKWVEDSKDWAEPTWPLTNAGVTWNRKKLEEHYKQWTGLSDKGIGVHCGEGGAFCHTPHKIFLSWLAEVLEILTGHGIGYALWNFRGTFGVLDSCRQDVDYKEWRGHKLDYKLLELLQRF